MAFPQYHFAEDVNIQPCFWSGLASVDVNLMKPIADKCIELVVVPVLEDPWLPVTFQWIFGVTCVRLVQIQIELMDFVVFMVEIHQGVLNQCQM